VGKKPAKSAAALQLVTLRQLHSPVVQVIEKSLSKNGFIVSGREYASLATKDGRAVLRGDGVMTDVPGLLLGIQTADCIPILVSDPKTGAVAAFHAGWRPTLARIVERGIGRMRLQYGSDPKNLIATIGPGIGPCCYAVGEEIRYEFESQFAYWNSLFTEVYDEDPVKTKYPLLFLTARAPGHSPIGPQTHLNLWEANRRQLLAAGVPLKNITVTGLCTACNTERFFSHRAERGFTGRMLNVIGVIS
jgi:YfiH family protein